MPRYWENPDFNPGGLPDKADPRDYEWPEIAAGLPPFDWNAGYDIEQVLGRTLPVKSQNGSGSCGGQAWSQYAGVLGAILTGEFKEKSAKYIYAQTFVQPNGGSGGRDNCNVLIKQGCCDESALSSYENGKPPSESYMERYQDVSEPDRENAKFDRALAYANVPVAIDAVAQAMSANHGAILLIRGSNNGSWGTSTPKPPVDTDPYIWSHWIYCGKARLINGQKTISFINSWGPEVGESGWQTLTEAYFAAQLSGYGQAIWSCWTHVINTHPVPSAFAYNFARPMRSGDQSEDIAALQAALQSDGDFPASVPISGYYGGITSRAVLAFQSKHQVAPAAELAALAGRFVGPATLAALNAIFNH